MMSTERTELRCRAAPWCSFFRPRAGRELPPTSSAGLRQRWLLAKQVCDIKSSLRPRRQPCC